MYLATLHSGGFVSNASERAIAALSVHPVGVCLLSVGVPDDPLRVCVPLAVGVGFRRWRTDAVFPPGRAQK